MARYPNLFLIIKSLKVSPFKPCECRVVPLKPGVSLYTLNPTTRKVTPFRGTRTSYPSVFCSAHPFFVITYACYALVNPSKTVRRKLALGLPLIQCIGPWHMAPPFKFYEGTYIGQFGRRIPYKYRPLLPTSPHVPDLVHSSSSSSSSLDSRSSKRSRLSTPSQSDSEPGVDIAKWVSDCAEAEFASDVDGPVLDVAPCKTLTSPEAIRRRTPKRKRS